MFEVFVLPFLYELLICSSCVCASNPLFWRAVKSGCVSFNFNLDVRTSLLTFVVLSLCPSSRSCHLLPSAARVTTVFCKGPEN